MHIRHRRSFDSASASDSANRGVLLTKDRPRWEPVTAMLAGRGVTLTPHRGLDPARRDLNHPETALVIVDGAGWGEAALQTLASIRKSHSVPMVAIVDGGDAVAEALALRTGADLVLSGIAPAGLTAERVLALLRRQAIASGARQEAESLQRGPLRIDAERHAALWRGQDARLTRKEFTLLRLLAQRAGYLRTRDQIVGALYDAARSPACDRTIDSHIKRLRAKLRRVDPAFDGIETVYGLGYRLHLPPA